MDDKCSNLTGYNVRGSSDLTCYCLLVAARNPWDTIAPVELDKDEQEMFDRVKACDVYTIKPADISDDVLRYVIRMTWTYGHYFMSRNDGISCVYCSLNLPQSKKHKHI